MTRIESHTNGYQCSAQDFNNSGRAATVQDLFRQAAEDHIRTFLRGHRLPAEEASEIFFNIEPQASDDLIVHIQGNILRALLIELKNQLLNKAISLGVCEFDYNPSTPPEEDDLQSPRATTPRRAATPEIHFELRLDDNATLEVQTPPTPAPVDEATRTPIPAEKEPREQSIVMNFDGQGTTQTIALPDGRVLTIHVAPGIEIVGPEPDGSPTMTFE